MPTSLSPAKRPSPPWAAATITCARVACPFAVSINVPIDEVTSNSARVRDGEFAALHRLRARSTRAGSSTAEPTTARLSVAVEAGKPAPIWPFGAGILPWPDAGLSLHSAGRFGTVLPPVRSPWIPRLGSAYG